MSTLPATIADEAALEELLSRPSEALVEELNALDGDITILGIGGKMGPTLARMAKRAAPDKRVIGVARFSQQGLRERLEGWGIETVACDLLDAAGVEKLEKTRNVVFMAGFKFGASGNPGMTWAMNVHVPAIVAQAFRGSRIAMFSTACVYPFVDITQGGASETVPLDPPGEYANSCVGRERMFEHFSAEHDTPVSIVRLSYAIDLRYGVLHDIAQAVASGTPLEISNGHCNVIWQADASDIALRTLTRADTPPFVLNLSGPEVASVRQMAQRFGGAFNKTPVFAGQEDQTAWLVDTGLQQRLYGYPTVPLATLVDWTADWVARGGASLGKPTHFEVRNGAY